MSRYAEARRAAEEWLRINDSIPYAPDDPMPVHVHILRSLLAASPEPAPALQTLHACAKCRRMFYRPSHPEFGCDGTAVLMPDEAQPAPACGSVSTVRSDDPPAKPLPTCANCGSNFITPAPAAHDAVAEAAEILCERLAGAGGAYYREIAPGLMGEVDALKAALDARRRG